MGRSLQVPKQGIHPLWPGLPANLPFIPGKIWHVKLGVDANGDPNGNDGATGKEPHTALASLGAGLAAATANRNDVILVYGGGNASARCTDYQSSTAGGSALIWNKDMVHLIAAGSGVRMSPRARVGFLSTFNTASSLFKLSANGCYIQGLQFWGGVDGSALPVGCVEVTGRMNFFKRCHIAGMNGAAGINDIANAYSLKLTGAIENEFEECVIGSATNAIGAGATSSQIRFATLAQENQFRRCKVLCNASHETNHIFLRAPAGSGVVFNEFEDCSFINIGTTLTYGMLATSDCGGLIMLSGDKTWLHGATDWNSSDSGTVIGCGIGKNDHDFGFTAPVVQANS